MQVSYEVFVRTSIFFKLFAVLFHNLKQHGFNINFSYKFTLLDGYFYLNSIFIPNELNTI